MLREGPLHRELKGLLAAPGDAFEVRVDGYVIDLVRADGELVEIQTGGFSPLRTKLDALLDRHRMRIVHPIPARAADRPGRRGRRGALRAALAEEARARRTIFEGLVSFPTLLSHPNLTIEVLLCREDHVRAPAPGARPALPARPGRAAPDRGARAHRARAAPADAAALIPRSTRRSPRASSRRRCASRSRWPRRPPPACARWEPRAGRQARPRPCTVGRHQP